MNKQTWMEIVDTRQGEATPTGIGAMFKKKELTIAAFNSAKTHHTEGADFLLDLYIDDDLFDTIELTADSVEHITGKNPL